MAVRAAVQQIALEHRRRYGYRRVTAELRRRGMAVNHKRVVRLMGEDQLLALRRRPWVATTNAGHELQVYVNLARRMVLSAPDQLWVADITYIRLAQEFVYLAVVVDGFSRRAVGWALGPRPAHALDGGGAEHGPGPTPTRSRPGAPLRSRHSVCRHRLRQPAGPARHHGQHEPTG